MKHLVDSLHAPFFQRALVEAALVGALAGVVSVHVLLRRLPFFVVAMSHATFPGIVLASVAGVSLFVGGWAFGLVVIGAVLALGSVRSLDDASSIGVVLAGSFAVGVLVLSAQQGASRDLSAFLVGSVLTVGRGDVVTTAVVGAGVLAALAAFHKELVLGAFDRGAAAALGYPTAFLDALVLVVVMVVLVTSVPAVGTLLAVALLTVPALTARLWVERIGPAMAVAAGVGAGSGVVGLCLSAVWGIAAGGAIALVAAGTFVVSIAVLAALRRSPRNGPAGRSGDRPPGSRDPRPQPGPPRPAPAPAGATPPRR